MPFDVKMPDGTVIKNVPDGTTKSDLARRYSAFRPMSAAEDFVRQTPSAIGKAAIGTAGMAGDIGSVLQAAANATGIDTAIGDVARSVGVDPQQLGSALRVALRGTWIGPFMGPGSQDLVQSFEKNVTEFRKPQNEGGAVADRVAPFALGALLPGGLAQRASQSILPALGQEGARAGARAVGANEDIAGTAGAVLAALTPAGAAKIVSPLSASKSVVKAAKNLKKEGITSVTAGQATGRKGIRALESEKGGEAAQNVAEKGMRQFTAAALNRAGIPKSAASEITTFDDMARVLDSRFDDIGKEFDRLASTYQLPANRIASQDAATVLAKYFNETPEAAQLPGVAKIADELIAALRSGAPIKGEKYKAWRSFLGRAVRQHRKDNPEAAIALREFQTILDDGMEAAIRAVNPSDAGAFGKVRGQYRTMVILEDAAVRSGQNSAKGIIAPNALRGAVQKVAGKRSFARGREDLGKLAKDGELVLTDLPNSGTAPRLGARDLGISSGTGTLGGAIGFALTGSPVGAAVGAGAGAVLPGQLARAALTGPGRAYLSNQAATAFKDSLSPARSAAIGGALSSR